MEFKTMSRAELLSTWLEAWGEEYPSSRGPKMDRYYPVSEFEVAIKDGKPIAAVGYGEKAGYNFKGMSHTKPEYLNEGLWTRMFRDLSGKSIVGLSQKAEGFTQKDWESVYRRKGWTINPSDEELGEVFGEDRDESITEPFVAFYRNHPVNTWAVNNNNVGKWDRIVRVGDKMGWQDILKGDGWVPKKIKSNPTYKTVVIDFLKRNRRGMDFQAIKKGVNLTRMTGNKLTKILDELKKDGLVEEVYEKFSEKAGRKKAYMGKLNINKPKVFNWIGE